MNESLYPIREVSKATGITPITLRAWERRYGLIEPVRTDSGHRLYTQAHIDYLRQAVNLTETGVPISKVKELLKRRQVKRAQHQTTRDGNHKDSLVKALQERNLEALEQQLNFAFSDLPDTTLRVLLMEITLDHEVVKDCAGALWESALLPRLYTRYRYRLESRNQAFKSKILVHNLQDGREVLSLLAADWLVTQGFMPVIPHKMPVNSTNLQEAAKRLSCQTIALIGEALQTDQWRDYVDWAKQHSSYEVYLLDNNESVPVEMLRLVNTVHIDLNHLA